MKGKNYKENTIIHEVRILHVLSHLICLKLNLGFELGQSDSRIDTHTY